jgi:glycosyltransferase involved in cell wall biosynthesis
VTDRPLNIGILGDPEDVHVQRWCAGLAARGLKISLLCTPLPDGRLPGIDYLDVSTPEFSLRYPYRRSERLRRRFQKIFRAFDIVHMHNLHNWGLDESITACSRLMVSTYGSDVLAASIPGGTRGAVVDADEHTARGKGLALDLAEHITATSNTLADGTAQYANIPRNEIEVIPFGVDPGLFAPRRIKRTERGHVGYCGSFRPNKGARRFIEAAFLVRQRFGACTFSLHGDGHDRQQFEDLVAARGGADAIRFHDFVPHARLPGVLDTFDLLAVPSICREAYSVMAVEAQAMQVPVVASRIGGLPETVRHGETGLLVEPGDPAAIADAICTLLADEPRRLEFGRAGREWVSEHHNWSHCLDRMIAAYHRVAEGYSRPRKDSSKTPASTTAARVPAATA